MSFIVICQQVVGGDGRPFAIDYHFDGEHFSSRQGAIRHGFKIRGSDDFNVAKVVRGKLIGFYWMGKDMSDPDEMSEISRQLGLRE